MDCLNQRIVNKYTLNLIVVLIAVGLTIFIQNKYFKDTVIETTVEVKTDTVTVVEKVFIKSEPAMPDTVEVPIFEPYDTSKCDSLYKDLYMKYGTKLAYSDTIYNDSIVTVKLNEIVSKNSVFDRRVEVIKRIPIITNTVTVTNTNYANSFYIGGIISRTEITPSIMYATKNYTILAGYNLTSKTPVIGVGVNLNKIIKW